MILRRAHKTAKAHSLHAAVFVTGFAAGRGAGVHCVGHKALALRSVGTMIQPLSSDVGVLHWNERLPHRACLNDENKGMRRPIQSALYARRRSALMSRTLLPAGLPMGRGSEH